MPVPLSIPLLYILMQIKHILILSCLLMEEKVPAIIGKKHKSQNKPW